MVVGNDVIPLAVDDAEVTGGVLSWDELSKLSEILHLVNSRIVSQQMNTVHDSDLNRAADERLVRKAVVKPYSGKGIKRC